MQLCLCKVISLWNSSGNVATVTEKWGGAQATQLKPPHAQSVRFLVVSMETGIPERAGTGTNKEHF